MSMKRGLQFIGLCKSLMEKLGTSEWPFNADHLAIVIEQWPGTFTLLISCLLGRTPEWVSRSCEAREILVALPTLLELNHTDELLLALRFLGVVTKED